MAAIGTPDLGGGKPPPLVPPDLSGIDNAIGNALSGLGRSVGGFFAAPLPQPSEYGIGGNTPVLGGALKVANALAPALSPLPAYQNYRQFQTGNAGERLGALGGTALGFLGMGMPEDRVASDLSALGNAGRSSERYIVNRGKTINTVIDTTTGKPLPLAFEDADKAERLAAARNAAAAGNAVHAIPEARSAYDRILGRSTASAVSPAAAGTDLQRMVASGRDFTRVPAAEAAASEAANPSVVRRGLPMPQEAAAQQAEARAASDLARRTAKPGSFGSPGTAFAGVSPRGLTRTIQATTPYRSIKEFGAAVRSGEAAKSGAPQGLVEQFLRGETEMGLRARGVAQSEIDRLMGRAAPVLRPASPVGVSGPLTESERAEALHAAQAGEFPSSTPTEANSARAKQISDSLEKVGIHHTPEEVYDDLTGGAAAGVVAPPVPPSRPGVLRTVENVSGLGKSLSTALSPFHFLFRHALPFAASHPVAWLRGVPGALHGIAMSPTQVAARIDDINADLASRGVAPGEAYIARPPAGVRGGEEEVPSTFLHSFPVLGGIIQRGGQGFTMGLNEVRYNAIKGAIDTGTWLAEHGLGKPMTEARIHGMVDTVNKFSGRGFETRGTLAVGPLNIDKGELARLLNTPMFSPELTVARVRMLEYSARGILGLAKGLTEGKIDPVALEQVRLGVGYATGVGALIALSTSLGGKFNTNILNSAGGQIDLGKPSPANAMVGALAPTIGLGFHAYSGKNATLDPTASEETLIRNIARFAVAIHDQATGEHKVQGAAGLKREPTPKDVATSYLVSQLFTSPVAYPILEWLSGYAASPLGMVTPMVVSGAIEGGGGQLPTVGGKAAKAAKAAGRPLRTPAPRPVRTARPVRTPIPRSP